MDLRAQAPHFYELAARVLDLFEEDEIVDVLNQVGCLDSRCLLYVKAVTHNM